MWEPAGLAPSRLQAVGFSLTGQSDLHIRNVVERAHIGAVHVHDVINAPHVETAVFGKWGSPLHQIAVHLFLLQLGRHTWRCWASVDDENTKNQHTDNDIHNMCSYVWPPACWKPTVPTTHFYIWPPAACWKPTVPTTNFYIWPPACWKPTVPTTHVYRR